MWRFSVSFSDLITDFFAASSTMNFGDNVFISLSYFPPIMTEDRLFFHVFVWRKSLVNESLGLPLESACFSDRDTLTTLTFTTHCEAIRYSILPCIIATNTLHILNSTSGTS